MTIKQTPADDIQHNYQREIIQKRAPREFGKTSQDQDISAEPPKPTVEVRLGWLGAVPGGGDWKSNFNSIFRLNPSWRHYYYTTLLCQYGFFKGAYHNTLQEIVKLDTGDTLKLQSAPPKAQNHGVKNFIMDKPQVTLADVVIPDQLIPDTTVAKEEANTAKHANDWTSFVNNLAKNSPDQLLPLCQGINATDKPNGTMPITKSLNEDYLAIKDGYLYVFKGTSDSSMTLDQEYFLNDSQLYPIDLTQLAGTDQRQHTFDGQPGLQLEPGFSYQIAVSHWQWSWARINYFGGIDPAFKGLSGAAKDAIANQSKTTIPPSSGSVAQQNRLARFGKAVSITQAMTTPQRAAASVKTPDTISPQLVCVHDGQPLVWFIDDPVRMALEINNDLIAAHCSLLSSLTAIGDRPYSDSAFLAYQSFFNPAIAKRGFSQQVYNNLMLGSMAGNYMSAGASPDPNFQNNARAFAEQAENTYMAAGAKINQNTIRDVLSVDMRRQLRYQMRWLQSTLVQLFMQKADNSKGMVSIHEALKDGFSAPDLHYGDAFGSINALFARLPFDPSCFDEKFDIVPDEVLDRKSNLPSQLLVWSIGSRYLNTLSKPNHPLYKCIFPEVAVVNTLPPVSDSTLEYQVVENDGSGQFRIHAFRANYYGPTAYQMFQQITSDARPQSGRTDVPQFDDAYESSFGSEGFKTTKGAIKAMMLPTAFTDTALGVYVFDQVLAGLISLMNHATRINSPSSDQLLTMTEMLEHERSYTRTHLLYLIKATNDALFVSLNTGDIAAQYDLQHPQVLGQVPHWMMKNFGNANDWKQPLNVNDSQVAVAQQYRSVVKDQYGKASYQYSNLQHLGAADSKEAQNAFGSMVPKSQLIPLDYRQHEQLITFNTCTYDISHMYKPWDEEISDSANSPGVLKKTLQRVRRVNEMLMTKKGIGPIFGAFQLFNLVDSIEMLHNDMANKKDKQRFQHELEDWLRIAMIINDIVAVTAECLESWGNINPTMLFTTANIHQPHGLTIGDVARSGKHPRYPHDTEVAFNFEADKTGKLKTRYFMCRKYLVSGATRWWSDYLKYMARASNAAIAAFSICDLMHSHNLNDVIGNSLSAVSATADTAEMMVKAMERKKQTFTKITSPKKIQPTDGFSTPQNSSQPTDDFKTANLTEEPTDSFAEAATTESQNATRSIFSRITILADQAGLTGGIFDGFANLIWMFPRAVIVCVPIIGELASIGLIAWGIIDAIVRSQEDHGIDAWAAFGPFGNSSESTLGPWCQKNLPTNQSWFLDSTQFQEAWKSSMLKEPNFWHWRQTEHSKHLACIWAQPSHGPYDCYASLLATLGNPTISIQDTTLNNTPVKQVTVNIGCADISINQNTVCIRSQWQIYQAQSPRPANPQNPTILQVPYTIYHDADTDPQICKVIQVRDSQAPYSIVAVVYLMNNQWKVNNDSGMWQSAGTFKVQLWAACQIKQGNFSVLLPYLTVDDQMNEWDGDNTAPAATTSLGCPPNRIYAQNDTEQNISWVRALPSPPLTDIIITNDY